MSNKLGVVSTATNGKRYIEITAACPNCGSDAGKILFLPERLKDVPEGFLVYVDDQGQLQVMEEDPHDYR